MKKTISFAIAVLLITFLFCSCSQESEFKGIGSEGISLHEFDSLWLDMSQDKVNSIIGGSGKLISESKHEDADYYYYIRLYRYEGELDGYAEIEFTHKVSKQILGPRYESRLSSKTNYSLK